MYLEESMQDKIRTTIAIFQELSTAMVHYICCISSLIFTIILKAEEAEVEGLGDFFKYHITDNLSIF